MIHQELAVDQLYLHRTDWTSHVPIPGGLGGVVEVSLLVVVRLMSTGDLCNFQRLRHTASILPPDLQASLKPLFIPQKKKRGSVPPPPQRFRTTFRTREDEGGRGRTREDEGGRGRKTRLRVSRKRYDVFRNV
ncbi:hypothetical protein CgunFtcFv8_017126 [Champsocephalus gunnari]|uniref:Uncharacterized protein n=1 Tax=Champsocephalus gunnari TaxID=52237 RepID=A0AAN8HR31_CHAGU|nr:hypothetical protein CgunFtcFv8_017126 [Champsocephalus gunnari]